MSTNPGRELLSMGANFVPTHRHEPYSKIDPTKLNLAGKNVFITGTSRGIGVELVKSFAAAGASKIAITARSDSSQTAKEARAAAVQAGRPEPQILDLKVDISDRQSVDAAAAQIRKDFGHLDIVVNNAGYSPEFAPVADSDPDIWWATWETNMKGSYLVARATIPLLLASPHPLRTLVLISSTGAHMLMEGASGYQTTKFGILRLAEFIDAEYSKAGILVYSVHPGLVPTGLAQSAPEPMRTEFFIDSPKLPADTIAWFTSERREWLGGRYVSVSWDVDEFLAKKDEIVKHDLLKVRMAVEPIQP